MKLKRLVSGILACALSATAVLSTFAFTASAADTVAVSVGSATVKAGETFSVDVNLTSIPSGGINALEFAVGYDSSAITITSVTAGAIADPNGAAAAELALNSGLADSMVSGSTYSCLDYAILEDQVSITWVTALEDSNYWLKSTGVLCTITGTVSDSASGTYDLSVESIYRESYSGSGVYNSSMYFAKVDADLNATYYTASGSNGTITITSGGMYGDINGDGAVDAIDGTLATRYAVGAWTAITAQGSINGDVNGDGVIDAIDATLITRYAVGTITKFPIQA